MISRHIKSFPECIFMRPLPFRLTSSSKISMPTPKSQTPKDFRIKEMTNKKSHSKFLSIPKSKAKTPISERCSKDADDSSDSGGFSKHMSAKVSDRSDRSIGPQEDKNKEIQPAAFKPQRKRIVSGTFRNELTPPPTYNTAKFIHPPKNSGSKDNLRKSATCSKVLTNNDLPPISKKETNKVVSKYPSVRVFPSAN